MIYPWIMDHIWIMYGLSVDYYRWKSQREKVEVFISSSIWKPLETIGKERSNHVKNSMGLKRTQIQVGKHVVFTTERKQHQRHQRKTMFQHLWEGNNTKTMVLIPSLETTPKESPIWNHGCKILTFAQKREQQITPPKETNGFLLTEFPPFFFGPCKWGVQY